MHAVFHIENVVYEYKICSVRLFPNRQPVRFCKLKYSCYIFIILELTFERLFTIETGFTWTHSASEMGYSTVIQFCNLLVLSDVHNNHSRVRK